MCFSADARVWVDAPPAPVVVAPAITEKAWQAYEPSLCRENVTNGVLQEQLETSLLRSITREDEGRIAVITVESAVQRFSRESEAFGSSF